MWILHTRGETTSKNLLLIHVLCGFVTKKSMKSEEDKMILSMQEHHNTVSAKKAVGVEKGEVCGFLYLVNTVIAPQSQNLTRLQSFSLKWDEVGVQYIRPASILVPRPRRFFWSRGCWDKKSLVRCLAVRSEPTMRIFVTRVNE